MIFYKSKNTFFKFLKTDLIFFKSKDFVLCNKKTYVNFYVQKPFFIHIIKQIWQFWQIKTIFFLSSPKQIWFFSKEETSFINKFAWFKFFYIFNISFMTCIKRYIDHNSLEDQTLFGWNGCLTPSHSVT